MNKSVNYIRSETEFFSVDDILNMNQIESNYPILVTEIRNVINEENVLKSPNTENEATFIEFIKKSEVAQLQHH